MKYWRDKMRKIDKKTRNLLIESFCQIAGITLCLIWYNWKLLVVLFLLLFGNNLMIRKN